MVALKKAGPCTDATEYYTYRRERERERDQDRKKQWGCVLGLVLAAANASQVPPMCRKCDFILNKRSWNQKADKIDDQLNVPLKKFFAPSLLSALLHTHGPLFMLREEIRAVRKHELNRERTQAKSTMCLGDRRGCTSSLVRWHHWALHIDSRTRCFVLFVWTSSGYRGIEGAQADYRKFKPKRTIRK